MTSLADKTILSGADNRPPMLEKDMYDSWKSRMELYMLNKQHGRMILESIENGPLLWPTVEEDGVTRLMKYYELSAAEAIQADCDVKATNIILQGIPMEVYALVSTHKVAKEFRYEVALVSTTLFLFKLVLESKFTPVEESISVLETMFVEGVVLTVVFPDLWICSVNLICLLLFFGVTTTSLLPKSVMQGQALGYHNPCYLKRAQQLKPKLYDGSVMEKSDAIVIHDSEETLLLTEESRLKMIEKQNDPKMAEKKVITKPIDYVVLNQLSKDFETQVHNQDNITNNLMILDVQTSSTSEQSTILTQSDTEIISDSNIISYSQYMNESQYNTIQNSNVPALQDDLILSVIKQLKTQVVNCTKINQDDKQVKELLTTELERVTIQPIQGRQNSVTVGSSRPYATGSGGAS
nr:hypothetical protein [Tanacetum cinerariifolium]